MGGHFDSWDVGTGAIDDGGGCIVTWEALRLMRALNLRPRRTVRVVLFVNEENGLRGALAYRDQHKAELPNHVLMLESDSGVFRPRGFGFTGAPEARGTLESIALLLRCIGADRIGPSGGGPDIGPSVAMAQIPAMSLDTDESEVSSCTTTPPRIRWTSSIRSTWLAAPPPSPSSPTSSRTSRSASGRRLGRY